MQTPALTVLVLRLGAYGKAGISLPRTAQAQYDATQHIPLSQAKAGKLVFFHSTYNSGTYVTQVGVFCRKQQNVSRWQPYWICRFNKPVLAETLDWCWSGKIKIERKWYYDI